MAIPPCPLFHLDSNGALAPLANVAPNPAVEYLPVGGCQIAFAPVSASATWVVDGDCQVSYWDGKVLSARTKAPAGYREMRERKLLWSNGPNNLWLSSAEQPTSTNWDLPINRLQRFDGDRWIPIETGRNYRGIIGTDDGDVWVWDEPGYESYGGNTDLFTRVRRWTETGFKDVTTLRKGTHQLRIGGDSLWAISNANMYRLKATRVTVSRPH